MTQFVFVTGTDTGIGKTYACRELLRGLNALSYTALGIKPLATGSLISGLSEDALQLLEASEESVRQFLPPALHLQQPIAPHLSAQVEGQHLSVEMLLPFFKPPLPAVIQHCVIEGVGGWRVPLNEKELLSDVVMALNVPVILVVGVRLGCLNHALLTAEAIESDGMRLLGWIANCIDPTCQEAPELITHLESRIPAPLLGILPFASTTPPLSLAQKYTTILASE